MLIRTFLRKTKYASTAQEHLQVVLDLLANKDESLVQLASTYVPKPPGNKKRKSAQSDSTTSPKKKQANKSDELAEREDRAMDMLESFIEEHGGDKSLVAGFRARVTKKSSNNKKYDTNYFNAQGRRFRSMLEVGRFFQLVKDDTRQSVRRKNFKAGTGSKAQEAEKKRIRRELDKLRKAHQRATKALDEFNSEQKESQYPVDDIVLMEEEAAKPDSKYAQVTRATCAAARSFDVGGFPGIPEHCIPDILMSWDFLCTFHRAISLTPIDLDDFAAALAYVPPSGYSGDDILAPPVYIAETHLGLLKLLFLDKSSDDWWWSTLETDEIEAGALGIQIPADSEGEEGKPVIKVDMAALLAEVEDPLITTSWLRALQDTAKNKSSPAAGIQKAIKTSLKVMTNKWAKAYLKKVLRELKSQGPSFGRRAVLWIFDWITEARPDLYDRSVKPETVFERRAHVLKEAEEQMERLPPTALAITDDDAADAEDDEDDDEEEESEDESDDDDDNQRDPDNFSTKPASVVPPRPLPTLVDMLLPPEKPQYNDEFVNAFSWSHLVGAAAARILHRKKRVWNEIDDNLRASRMLEPIQVPERREREKIAVSRTLTECLEKGRDSDIERAIEKLCNGENYLVLNVMERLCVLRILIEAAYDTTRLYDIVDGNYKQRANAMKSLEQEQRKAKKEAKERAAADEAAAREKLAQETKDKFFDEKREEIRKLNERSNEFEDEIIESLTEEDILEFDEDIKADFEALPKPDTFNKTEVNNMIIRMKEEAAFDSDSLRVITLDELVEREHRELEEMEGQLSGLGGENALNDPSTDSETARLIENLSHDIDKLKANAEKLPQMREKAMEQLRDAIQDGTIKVLKGAITAAKRAKLSGPDEETGGIWAVELLRDASLELENAKQNKKVVDAQKDLVTKRNKCFIRSEPLGRDRFGNRFWTFGHDEDGHIWKEVEYSLKNGMGSDPQQRTGFCSLFKDGAEITTGAKDIEDDLISGNEDIEQFRNFSRREYHSSGFSEMLSKHLWGCHTTEESIRAVIKSLDSRGTRENELKTNLKEALEELAGKNEKHEKGDDNGQDHEAEVDIPDLQTSGDESAFETAKEAAKRGDDIRVDFIDDIVSGIRQRVRVRQVIEESKESSVARYESGEVTGWKLRRDKVAVESDTNDMDLDEDDVHNVTKIVETPVWKVRSERGHIIWLKGKDLVESLDRYKRMISGNGYAENDAPHLAYRNHLGRHCGKASDATLASSPIFLARLMVKREAELYAKLKIRSYDNSWGGKSGNRAAWMNSMKDYAFDLSTVKQGLLTLESAFFQLTGEFDEYENTGEAPDVQALLSNPATRVELELETIEKSVPGLWNSTASRAVFIQIVSNCNTTGFLALAFDLLCRNTIKYLRKHKILDIKTEIEVDSFAFDAVAGRRTRRQQANYNDNIYDDLF